MALTTKRHDKLESASEQDQREDAAFQLENCCMRVDVSLHAITTLIYLKQTDKRQNIHNTKGMGRRPYLNMDVYVKVSG